MKQIITIIYLLLSITAYAQGGDEAYIHALASMSKGKYQSAIELFDKEINRNPNNMKAVYQRGICHYKLNRFDMAISDFILVNKRVPARSSLMLAKCEARLGHEELAIKYLREHLSSKYKIQEKDILLDPDLDRISHLQLWKKLWQEKEWYTAYERELNEAKYLKSTGNYPDALNLLEKLDERGVNRSEVNRIKAEIYLENNNPEAAEESLNESVRSNRNNSSALKMRIALDTQNGNYKRAEHDCRRLIQQSPQEFSYYLTLADMLAHNDKFAEAQKYAEFYLSLFPESASGLNILGVIHYRNKQYLNALKVYNTALESEQGKSELFFNRGRVYAATDMYEYASRDYAMALDLEPTNADIWFEKGISDLERGDEETACFNFKKSLQYGRKDALDFIHQICK
ncbi:MAG TPA: tetratricopeptide repeat protein [Bacteroidales bacterium]|nr:tetratricopeptide repeat protein [Bacteroidales bacterium]